MEPSNALSDDEYDVISNPGNISLEANLADFCSCDTREPPASENARNRFETTGWTAREVQLYVQKSLDTNANADPQRLGKKRVRVYVDGAFDSFDVGTALKLRQAKLSFPHVHLVVGVFSDKTLQQYECLPPQPEVERIELIRHCRWTDEVLEDAPWELSLQFLKDRAIDFVAIDEGASIDPSIHKARVVAFDELKRQGKIIKTRRTLGLAKQQLPSLQSATSSQQSTPILANKDPGF